MKFIVKLVGILLPVIAIVLLVCQVVVSNELATLGKKLGKIDYQVSLESDIHEALTAQVASASSLMTVRERAATLGFVEPSAKQIVHVSLTVPVAFDTNQHTTNAPIE